MPEQSEREAQEEHEEHDQEEQKRGQQGTRNEEQNNSENQRIISWPSCTPVCVCSLPPLFFLESIACTPTTCSSPPGRGWDTGCRRARQSQSCAAPETLG